MTDDVSDEDIKECVEAARAHACFCRDCYPGDVLRAVIVTLADRAKVEDTADQPADATTPGTPGGAIGTLARFMDHEDDVAALEAKLARTDVRESPAPIPESAWKY